jgi:hypothetical protein
MSYPASCQNPRCRETTQLEDPRSRWWCDEPIFVAADIVGERTVFNIGGNKYRLVALIDYELHGVLIRFVGTHKEYDRIDVATT